MFLKFIEILATVVSKKHYSSQLVFTLNVLRADARRHEMLLRILALLL